MTIIKHIKTKKARLSEGEEPHRKRKFNAHIVLLSFWRVIKRTREQEQAFDRASARRKKRETEREKERRAKGVLWIFLERRHSFRLVIGREGKGISISCFGSAETIRSGRFPLSWARDARHSPDELFRTKAIGGDV